MSWPANTTYSHYVKPNFDMLRKASLFFSFLCFKDNDKRNYTLQSLKIAKTVWALSYMTARLLQWPLLLD